MSDYVDYAVFDSDSFDARQYANSLLLSTNDKDEQNLDFTSAQNKLKYDVAEVDAAVYKEVEEHWEELLERTELSASTINDVSAIEASLKSLSNTYDRVAVKAIEPYEAAQPLYEALSNMASTTNLLRALKRYLEIFEQVDGLKGSLERAAFLQSLDKCIAENKALMQIRIVIANLPRVDSLRAQTIKDCTTSIAQYEMLDTSIAALDQLDRSVLFRCLKQVTDRALTEANQALEAGFQISGPLRKLQSSDNTKAIDTFLQNLRNAFDKMGKIAKNLQLVEDACPADHLQEILENLFDSSASMKQYFWREFSSRISKTTRDVCRNDQWILRTLKAADIESIVLCGLNRGTMEFRVIVGSLSRR